MRETITTTCDDNCEVELTFESESADEQAHLGIRLDGAHIQSAEFHSAEEVREMAAFLLRAAERMDG